MELVDEDDIDVVTLMPASVDTPIFQHAANYAGRAVKPLNPVYDADRVAKAIVTVAAKPRRERIVGGTGRMMRQQRLMAPGRFERATARMVHQDHFQDQPAAPAPGNVLAPIPQWTSVSGGWASSPSPLRRAALPTLALACAAAAVGWRLRS